MREHEDGHEDGDEHRDEDGDEHRHEDRDCHGASEDELPDRAVRPHQIADAQGTRYELRFDPAWLLNGVAAEHAAVEDGAIEPGDSVPNDRYIVDEGHRLLTYVVLPTAHVTVLTRGLWHTVIPVSELAQILEGKNPQHRALFYPANGSASSAFTIRVGNKYPNPVVAVDQAYQP
jgi:hypothetical protein